MKTFKSNDTEDFTPSFVLEESKEVKNGMTTEELVLSITRTILTIAMWISYWFVFILVNHVRKDCMNFFRSETISWIGLAITMWLYMGFIFERVRYIKRNFS